MIGFSLTLTIRLLDFCFFFFYFLVLFCVGWSSFVILFSSESKRKKKEKARENKFERAKLEMIKVLDVIEVDFD